MQNEITLHRIAGRKVLKLRGGRKTQVFKDKSKYNRKRDKRSFER